MAEVDYLPDFFFIKREDSHCAVETCISCNWPQGKSLKKDAYHFLVFQFEINKILKRILIFLRQIHFYCFFLVDRSFSCDSNEEFTGADAVISLLKKLRIIPKNSLDFETKLLRLKILLLILLLYFLIFLIRKRCFKKKISSKLNQK